MRKRLQKLKKSLYCCFPAYTPKTVYLLQDNETESIASGGYGTISTARLTHETHCATKQPRNNNRHRAVHQHEINILQTIVRRSQKAHRKWNEHVLPFYGVTEDMKIVMQLCPTKKNLVETNYMNLPITNYQTWLKQLLSAIHWLHSLGIAHCDIKPDNVLFFNINTIKLADFGHATEERYGIPSRFTFEYQEPTDQFLQREHQFDKFAYDAWLTGLTICCMMFNEMPIHPKDNNEHLKICEKRKQKLQEKAMAHDKETEKYFFISLINLLAENQELRLKSEAYQQSHPDYDKLVLRKHIAGVGKFSTVYLGHWRGHLHAVKKPHPNKLCQDSLSREINTLKHLQQYPWHKHIIMIHGTAHDHIIMEYCHHNDLQQYPGLIPLTSSMIWLQQILSALQHLHNLDVYHGDVKMENILYFSNTLVKLCDFGFAHSQRDTYPRGATPHYLAPEIKFKRPPYNAIHTDLYATGVVFFQAGLNRPYVSSTKYNTFEKYKDKACEIKKRLPTRKIKNSQKAHFHQTLLTLLEIDNPAERRKYEQKTHQENTPPT